MATETVLMDAVKRGADRQEIHERIRRHSVAAAARVKEEGLDNDLVDRLAADDGIPVTREEILAILRPENFVGRAPEQTREYLAEIVEPLLAANAAAITDGDEITL